MGFSILMVDDDRILVDKLEETVRWAEIGISTVFTANNIRQAKGIIEQTPIDLMLCDIDMPQGSGLELLEWIRDNGYQTVCVFLSSYANFSYAQKAIRLGSADYLLKPISTADLEAALIKTIQDTMPIAGDAATVDASSDFWGAFAESENQAEYLEEGIQEMKIPAQQKLRFCMLRILDTIPDDNDRNRIPMDEIRIRDSIIETMGEGRLQGIHYLDSLSWFLVLTAGDPQKDEAKLGEMIRCFRERIAETPYLLVGHARLPSEAMQSFAELLSLRKTAIPGLSQIVFAKDLPAQEPDVRAFPWDAWSKELETAESTASLKEKLHQAVLSVQWTRSSMAAFVLELEYMINRHLHSMQLSNEQIYDLETFRIYSHAARRTVEGCLRLIDWTLNVVEGNRRTLSNTTDILKAYINEHLDEELSRRLLAQQVYLSEDYMSKLFAQETGMTLVNYITKCRIEKACEYLKDTDLRVGRIALSVGFNNFSYFSKTFRDLTGMTPNEYRDRYRS